MNSGDGIMLPKRLASIVSQIPGGSRVADIGSDHGYLPIELVKRGFPRPIATEHAPGPYQQCAESIAGYDIDLRFGSGLAPISPAEVDVVVIAGMSGQTIQEILVQSWDKVKQIGMFILQPMLGAEELRLFLLEREIGISHEWLVKERGKYYQYLNVIPEKISVPDQLKQAYPNIEEGFLIKIGCGLLLDTSELNQEYFQFQLKKLEKVLKRLDRDKHSQRYKEIEMQVFNWRQVIQCHTKLVNAHR